MMNYGIAIVAINKELEQMAKTYSQAQVNLLCGSATTAFKVL